MEEFKRGLIGFACMDQSGGRNIYIFQHIVSFSQPFGNLVAIGNHSFYMEADRGQGFMLKFNDVFCSQDHSAGNIVSNTCAKVIVGPFHIDLYYFLHVIRFILSIFIFVEMSLTLVRCFSAHVVRTQ